MSYPSEPGQSAAPATTSVGAALALGAGVAFAGAFVVGTVSGLTNYQSAYVSILLGWVVGLVVNRASREMPVAVAAGMLALAGSALASLIYIVIGLVRNLHVPLSSVLSNMQHVFPLVPPVIGWFGFLCWALSGVAAWATVRSRGRTLRRMSQPASLGQMSGGMSYRPLAGGSGSDARAMPDVQAMPDIQAMPGINTAPANRPPDGPGAPPPA